MNKGFITMLAVALLAGCSSFISFMALRAVRVERLYHYHYKKLQHESIEQVLFAWLRSRAKDLCDGKTEWRGEIELASPCFAEPQRYEVVVETGSDNACKVSLNCLKGLGEKFASKVGIKK